MDEPPDSPARLMEFFKNYLLLLAIAVVVAVLAWLTGHVFQ
jgi:hypothetical protein